MKFKVEREELKKKYPQVIELIQRKHEMPKWVEDALFHTPEMPPQKGLTSTGVFFATGGPLHVEYIMEHIIMNPVTKEIGRRITEVIIYDNYVEYETHRIRTLSKGSVSETTGLDLN